MSLGTRPDAAAAIGLPADRLFRLDAGRFARLVASGILAPGDRVELIDGVVHAAPDGPPYRFTLDQYHRLEAEGIVTVRDRAVLLRGWLIARAPIDPPHRISTRKVRLALERVLPPGWYADEQKPVTMPLSGSEPEPDVQVTRGDSADYAEAHPGPGDVALLVEVSDSTLSVDRNFMKRLYAAEGVPAYWIANLPQRRVEVFTEPSGPADAPDFARRDVYGPDDSVPLVLDGVELGRVPVRDLLP